MSPAPTTIEVKLVDLPLLEPLFESITGLVELEGIGIEELPATWDQWNALDAEEKGAALDAYFALVCNARGVLQAVPHA